MTTKAMIKFLNEGPEREHGGKVLIFHEADPGSITFNSLLPRVTPEHSLTIEQCNPPQKQ